MSLQYDWTNARPGMRLVMTCMCVDFNGKFGKKILDIIR